ncbi:MAG: ABC transporter permease [Thermoplasmatota archaeon]
MSLYLLRRAARTLRHIKFRAVGSGALIVASAALYLSMAGMIPSADRALEEQMEELRLNDYIVHVSEGSESEARALADVPGVRDVEARLQLSSRVELSGESTKSYAATLIGIDPNRLPRVNIPRVVRGDFFKDGAGALVERGFADKRGVDVGDVVRVSTGESWRELRVAGLVLSPEHLVLTVNPQALLPFPGSLAVLFVPMDWLRSSFGLEPGSVNEFLFLLEGDKGAAREAIDAALAKSVVLFSLRKEEVYSYMLIKEDLRQGESWAGVIALVMLLIAFFITYISFARLVQEQRREIGVLRALGYSRAAVLGSYLYLALLIGLAGSIVGTALGAPLALALAGFYVELMIGTALTAFHMPAGALAAALLFGPLTALLACGTAVWGAVSMEPQEAIRGTPKTFLARARGSAADRPRLVRGGYLRHYALRSLSRHKLRTTATVVAVAGSMVVGGMALLMWPAFINSLSEGLLRTERWDLMVDYSYPLNETEARGILPPEALQSINVSRVVLSWRYMGDEGEGVVIGMPQNQTLHLFTIREGRAAAGAGEALIERGWARERGIGVGSELALSGPGGTRNLRVAGLVEDFLGELFLDAQTLHELMGREFYNGALLDVDGGREGELRRSLLSSPLVADVYTPASAQSGMMEFMADYVSMIYVFSLVGVAMAAVTVSNILVVSVLERWHEFGQLKAIGYSNREVASSILTELFVMVGAASLLSAPMTYALLLGLEEEFRTFYPTYSTILYPLDWLPYLFVVGATFLFTVLAVVPSVRAISRMDLVKTVAGERFG